MHRDDHAPKPPHRATRALPALLLASAVTIPAAGGAHVPVDEALTLASRSEVQSTVLDTQANWQQNSLERQFQEQWVEASWGQVTWARAIPKY